MSATSYFVRESDRTFTATPLVSGAWNPDEQHIAAPMGLLTHVIEQDHFSRGGSLTLASVHFDILGVIPVSAVEVDVRVVRPGRTIELTEATLSHDGRAALIARAWFLREGDTQSIAGTDTVPLPPRTEMEPWDYTADWGGGFITSIDTYRSETSPGRAQGWARTRYPLLEGENVSTTAKVLGTIDTANGLSPRHDPTRVAFPNVDLTVNLVRSPVTDWVGYDTTQTFGATGLGLTHTVLHDEAGSLGAITQTLTVRPLQ